MVFKAVASKNLEKKWRELRLGVLLECECIYVYIHHHFRCSLAAINVRSRLKKRTIPDNGEDILSNPDSLQVHKDGTESTM